MAKVADIDTFIVREPKIRGGRPHIAGTGITVRRIVGWYKLGLTAEEIATEIPHLTLAQVHAALAYYHANREEIEADIAAEDDVGERLEREDYFSRQGSWRDTMLEWMRQSAGRTKRNLEPGRNCLVEGGITGTRC